MSRTLLLIEDEDDIREVAQACLELTRGWAVHAANSGVNGLALALDTHPDAILLDVMMPDLDGPGTLAELRKNHATADIPVIFLTAKVQTAERAKYLDLGAKGVLGKPFDPMTLGDDVAAILGWTD
jgi:DNA-binding response OmpR family regulator